MSKLLSLAAMGLVWGLVGPAWASPGPGESSAIVPQFPIRCIVPDQVSVWLTGKLQRTIHGLEVPAIPPEEGGRPHIIAVQWQINVNGKTYTLSFGKSKELEALANKAGTQTVEVNGLLVGGTVQVTGLRVVDATAQPGARVEIRGMLRYFVLERFPPIHVWEVSAAGQTYRLSLPSAELQNRGRDLAGRRVTVRGTLQNGQVAVTGMEVVPLTRC